MAIEPNTDQKAGKPPEKRAYAAGWKVRRPSLPSAVRIRYPGEVGWWLLDDDGGRTPA